ncbi:hypothetical protein E2542_SST22173 [Spatholobus suberectus]|nr:hypothetical protein E2542_SST22173 [Spatholobus suberectus]
MEKNGVRITGPAQDVILLEKAIYVFGHSILSLGRSGCSLFRHRPIESAPRGLHRRRKATQLNSTNLFNSIPLSLNLNNKQKKSEKSGLGEREA